MSLDNAVCNRETQADAVAGGLSVDRLHLRARSYVKEREFPILRNADPEITDTQLEVLFS